MNQTINEILKEYEEKSVPFVRPGTKKSVKKAFFDALEQMSLGNIPKHVPDNSDDYYMRKIFKDKFGMWAIVAQDWVEKLGEYLDSKGICTILEIQAGRGWLAKALQNEGFKVIATDDYSWELNKDHVYPVEKLDRLDAMKEYASKVDALLVSWPHFQDYGLVRSLNEAWPSDKPIIYIGERMGGCCACEEFFPHFDYEEIDVPFPSWDGLYDHVYIGYWDANAEEPKENWWEDQ